MSSVSASESYSHSDVAFNCIDDNAAAFMCAPEILALSPVNLPNRIPINSETPFEFENDYFSGRIVILHREALEYPFDYRYQEFFKTRKRRWELRWQGKFKKQLDDPIVFGVEMDAATAPKLSFASRAFTSMLIKFSRSLARARGSDLFTNVTEENPSSDEDRPPTPPTSPSKSGLKYFHFPIHTSDLILSTPPSIDPPSICIPEAMGPSEHHTVCDSIFKDPKNLPLDNTYTFVFYSMYMDFVSWDLQNVPLGLSGMSLNRLAGTQPISVVMRQAQNTLFRVVIGNRCTSPDWASFLSTGQPFDYDKMTDFFSISSFYSGNDDLLGSRDFEGGGGGESPSRKRWHVPRIALRKHRHPPTDGSSPRRRRRQFWLWRGIRKFVITPTKFIGTCLKAPVSFVINSASRKIPQHRKVVTRTIEPKSSDFKTPPLEAPIVVDGIPK